MRTLNVLLLSAVLFGTGCGDGGEGGREAGDPVENSPALSVVDSPAPVAGNPPAPVAGNPPAPGKEDPPVVPVPVPVSDAGPDRTASIGRPVTLSGLNSRNPGGGGLTYAWSLVERPLGSRSELSDANEPRVSFYPDAVGRYRVALVVGNGQSSSAPDLVEIKAFPEISHFLMSGQSLSVADGEVVDAFDRIDLKFSGGVHLASEHTGNRLVPLTPDGRASILVNALRQYRAMVSRSSSASGDADGRYSLLGSSHGVSGSSIGPLGKGGASYAAALSAVDGGRRLSSAMDKHYTVVALNWVQGESDRYLSAEAYKNLFRTLKSDYRKDVAASTQQATPLRVFTYQPSGQQFDRPVGAQVPNTIAQAFFESSEEDPLHTIVSPTYWVDHRDALHLTADGYLKFGLVWGKVMFKILHEHERWRPLEPISIRLQSATRIVARFNVPVEPLVLDENSVSNPGNFGFDVRDDSGVVPITSVSLASPDSVAIGLGRAGAGDMHVAYAFYGKGGAGGGPVTGSRGNLRDSDGTVGADGKTLLWNWAVIFNKKIPYEHPLYRK